MTELLASSQGLGASQQNHALEVWVLSNPYRVLGIPSSASLDAVHDGADAIRRSTKLGIAKVTPWDLPWLGPLERSEAAVRGALGRLNDPAQRLQSRLYWFDGDTAGFASLALVDLQEIWRGWPGTVSHLSRHDQALFLLAATALFDPEMENSTQWGRAFRQWRQLQEGSEYWRWTEEIDRAGRFEPGVSQADVQDAFHTGLERVTDTLVRNAADAARSANTGRIRSVMAVLQGAALPGEAAAEIRTQILRPLEDFIVTGSEQIRIASRDAVVRDSNSGDRNRPLCHAALAQFETQIAPRMTELSDLDGEAGPEVQRSREAAAICLAGLASDHTWADEFIEAEGLYDRARTLALGTAAFARINEAMERNAVVARQQEAHMGRAQSQRAAASRFEQVTQELTPITSAPSLYTWNTIGFRMYGATDRDPEGGSYLTTYYFVVGFLPVIPICRYRVFSDGGGRYRFIGKAPLRVGDKWHLAISLLLMFWFFVANCAGETPSRASSYQPTASLASSSGALPVTANPDPGVLIRPENTPPLAASPRTNGLSTRDSLDRVIERDRVRAAALEAQLSDMDRQLGLEDGGISSARIALEATESDMRFGVAVDRDAYERDLSSFNARVRRYNRRLQERQDLYDGYEKLLARANRAVDQYNALAQP